MCSSMWLVPFQLFNFIIPVFVERFFLETEQYSFPSGFQSTGAVYNCITCQYDSCKFPLDCPGEYH